MINYKENGIMVCETLAEFGEVTISGYTIECDNGVVILLSEIAALEPVEPVLFFHLKGNSQKYRLSCLSAKYFNTVYYSIKRFLEEGII